jgi:hypothetical protein
MVEKVSLRWSSITVLDLFQFSQDGSAFDGWRPSNLFNPEDYRLRKENVSCHLPVTA